MTDLITELVTAEHPIYAERKADWKRDEDRYRGGKHVRKELRPFAWETDDTRPDLKEEEAMARLALERAGAQTVSSTYALRQLSATYLNFPKRMTEKFVGRLSSESPKPGEGYNFGSLGKVSESADERNAYSRAEMVWTNCDLKGSPFVAWFNEVQRWAMVTGHRWVGVTAPVVAPQSIEDEANGLRPYLTHYSPLDVPNWQFAAGGELRFMVIRVQERVLVKDGKYHGKHEYIRLLYVARGVIDLGPEYVRGGWWKFDDEGKPLTGPGNQGGLEATGGTIPYTPFFYEQDEKELSRSGTSDLANIAISYMNISSAGDNDAIEGGGRTLYLLGVDQHAHNLATEMRMQGSRHIPVPTVEGRVPAIFDSGSVSASSAIEESLKRKVGEAALIAQDELRLSPDASGKARQVEFMDVKMPRLALMALNREAAERTILQHLCRFWGLEPTADVQWKKVYDMETTVEDWVLLFDTADRVGVISPTLVQKGLHGIATEKGLPLKREDWDKINAEVSSSLDRETQARAADPFSTFP